MPEWRNGRRARLKIVFRKGWRFESSLRHQDMKKVLAIVGPTASGKSALAIRLAKKLKGEVISADSRQVYKGLNIGTGKVTQKEMRGIPHHLLDVADPKKQFSVAEYQTLANEALEDIQRREKLPVVVGGTGFYIDALCHGFVLPEVPPNKKLRKELEKLSAETLYKQLKKKDPARAKQIDWRNKVRVIRALEIVAALGKVPSLDTKKARKDCVYIGLYPTDLEKRIYKRLLDRIPGIIRETKKLSKKRAQDLGLEYRFASLYLQKKLSRKEFVEELNTAIRQYARRQMTWFKRNSKIRWFASASDAYAAILSEME